MSTLHYEFYEDKVMSDFAQLLQYTNMQTSKQVPKSKLNKAQTTKQNENAHTKKKIVPFVLANYSWSWGLHWTMIDIPSVTPITSWLEALCPLFLFWNFVRYWLVQVLCILSQSVWIHMWTYVSRKCHFLGAIHHLWLLKYFYHLFNIDPWSLKWGVWWRHSI